MPMETGAASMELCNSRPCAPPTFKDLKETLAMKKISLVLGALFLIMFASTACAANWQYFTRTDFGGGCVVYVDTDSVVRDGTALTFWILEIFDTTYTGSNVKKLLMKEEVRLESPRMLRGTESHTYDSKGQFIDKNSTPDAWMQVPAGCYADIMINFALKYARDGHDSGQVPVVN